MNDMTPDEMRDILDRLGWSQRDLAWAAHRSASSMHKMARGRLPIDDDLAAWLRSLRAVLDHPPQRPTRNDLDASTQQTPDREPFPA